MVESDNIVPNKNNLDTNSLKKDKNTNVITVPFNGGQGDGAGNTGSSAATGGSSDSLPTISSSDVNNNFPALAGSMFNLAEV